MKLLHHLPGPVLWALAGAAAWYVFGPSPQPDVRYPDVVVPVARIEAQEPDTVVRWREKIVTKIVRPEQAATSSEPAASPDVASFCRSYSQERVDSALARHQGEKIGAAPSPTVPRLSLLLRSISTDPGYFGHSDEILLTGPLSDGRLKQLTYSARRGWSARVVGDSVLFRQPRWQWLRDYGEMGVLLGAGYLLGRGW